MLQLTFPSSKEGCTGQASFVGKRCVMQSLSRRRFLGFAICHASLICSIGCGTVLHPERRGQPAGPLDWGIVALDAVGLLLFFVPGVIAFAVDFSNGTIYLPPERYGDKVPLHRSEQLVTILLDDERITLRSLENAVSSHVRQAIRLTPGTYRTEQLASLDEFWKTTDKLGGV